MIRRPPRSTLSSSSAASDVYKRQVLGQRIVRPNRDHVVFREVFNLLLCLKLSLIHISEPTRLGMISYAVFCLKKKKKKTKKKKNTSKLTKTKDKNKNNK